MNLSQFKTHLQHIGEIIFLKPDGTIVPKHFHITEVGQIQKHFIDCGGTIRHEKCITMQLWENTDTWHRLVPQKLLNIIKLSEEKLGIEDLEIEIEYQGETIGKYDLGFDNKQFILLPKTTTCLASDSCLRPEPKVKKNLRELSL